MARVYVSSTVADLAEERRAVLDWLRLARHQAVDSYLPDSETVRDSCLDDVAGCDLYVLIAGHRYGFQPPEDNPEGLSITQLEFRRAGECGIPRVALLRTSVPDVRPRICRIRRGRRWCSGSAMRWPAGCVPAEFSDLQGLIQGLSTGVQGELAKLGKRDQGQGGREAAGLALRLAPRPVFLAGREELLAELDARLGVEGRRRAAGGGACAGWAVRARPAWRWSTRTGIWPRWGCAGSSRPRIRRCWRRSSRCWRPSWGRGRRRTRGIRWPRCMRCWPGLQAGWLVVFDNVPDRASVERFVPPAGPGRVLITTQNQHWPPGQALDVPVLDPEVAADFLVDRTGDPDRAAARELAAELGGLPLALEQAAAYMQATGTTLARYLPLFRARQADLLARGEVSGHPADVAATLGLALSRLADEAPAAAGLVRLLAFLAPEPVPLALLLAGEQAAGLLGPEVAAAVGPLLGDPVAAGDAITALRRYSLVSPAGDGLVLVHRLVQAITRAQLPAEAAGQWEQAAAALVEAAVPADAELPAAWPACAVLLPHARAVLDLTSSGMWRIAQYLGYSGSYPAARDLFRLIADAHREVMPTAPSTRTP